MLSGTLFAGVLTVSALTVGFLVLLAYRCGLRDGRAVAENRPLSPVVPRPLRKTAQSGGKNERLAMLSKNVEAYDGTAQNQRRIR